MGISLGQFGNLRRTGAATERNSPLRALYERVGTDAYSLACSLGGDVERAEEAVVNAFAAVAHAQLGRDAALDRRAVLVHVIAAFPHDSTPVGREHLTLALVRDARCSLDEVAQITGGNRRRVLVELTDSIRRYGRAM